MVLENSLLMHLFGPRWTGYRSELGTWACSPKNGFSQRFHPVIVFAEPRTGSTLFFDMLLRLNEESPPDQALSLLSLYELFLPKDMPDTADNLFRLVEHLDKACDGSNLLEGFDMKDGQFETPQSLVETLKSRHEESVDSKGWEMAEPVADSFLARMRRPMELLDYIWHLPSNASKSYFAFKIFDYQLKLLGTNPSEFLHWISDNSSTGRPSKYIILWRRRMLETFVSNTIGSKTNTWKFATTEADQAVHVEKRKLESFINKQKRYYLEVQRSLNALGLEYEVFEYSHDLLFRDQQIRTVQRVQKLLGISVPDDVALAEAVLKNVKRTKQAAVPLKDQIKNWEEVVAWGYGGEPEEWEDLFHG